MALVVIPPTEASVYADAGAPLLNPNDRARRQTPSSFLGFGLTRPFRRDGKSDFVTAGGVDGVKRRLGQLLGMRGANPDNPTRQGELEWAPERGSLFDRIRHLRNDDAAGELARVYAIDAIARWEPAVRVRSATVSRIRDDRGLERGVAVKLVYDVLSANQPGNQVLAAGVEQTLTFTGAR